MKASEQYQSKIGRFENRINIKGQIVKAIDEKNFFEVENLKFLLEKDDYENQIEVDKAQLRELKSHLAQTLAYEKQDVLIATNPDLWQDLKDKANDRHRKLLQKKNVTAANQISGLIDAFEKTDAADIAKRGQFFRTIQHFIEEK